MFGYINVEEFMKGAEAAVAKEATSFRHKSSNVKFKLRKAIRNAPLTAVQRGVALLPLGSLTGLVSKGVDAGIDKIKARKAQAKLQGAMRDAGREDADLEVLRTAAKHEAKALKDLTTKLEQNQVKLKAASETATKQVETVLFWTETNQIPTGKQCWDAACNIYERRRRAEKMLDMVDVIEGYLEGIKKYLAGVEESCEDQEKELAARLDEWEGAIEEEDQKNLKVTSNGYAKFPK